MPLLYLLIPGGLLLWLWKRDRDRDHLPEPHGAALERAKHEERRDTSVAWYVNHLMAAAQAANKLDQVRPIAEAGDIEGVMASEEADRALKVLASPIDVLTLQRDLNMLGSRPALAETGTMDSATKQAVASLQKRFGQVPTGNVDSDARIAIAYGVGKVFARDASALCGIRMGW